MKIEELDNAIDAQEKKRRRQILIDRVYDSAVVTDSHKGTVDLPALEAALECAERDGYEAAMAAKTEPVHISCPYYWRSAVPWCRREKCQMWDEAKVKRGEYGDCGLKKS